MDIEKIKVSAIIASHNRYESLMEAISSVKKQTHKNIEIIVVNDNSPDPRYYANRTKDVIWIDLPQSSKDVLGYPSPGYVRNKGLEFATGAYFASLDDDDLWLPDKIRLQLVAMRTRGYSFCCTEGLMGDGLMTHGVTYPVYHREYFYEFCKQFFEQYSGNWSGWLPEVFDKTLISKHNFIISASVLIERGLLDQVGFYEMSPYPPVEVKGKVLPEDLELWMRCLETTDCLHLNDPLVVRFAKTITVHGELVEP